MNFLAQIAQERAYLEQYYDEWRRKHIPVTKCTTQSFIVFLIEIGLLNDDEIHRYVDERENG